MDDLQKTQMGAPPIMDPNRTQMGTAPSADPNRTIMGNAPSLNMTVTITPVQCPVCKTPNPPGLIYCSECGLIFEKALDGDAFGAPSVQLPVLVDSNGKEHQLRPGDQTIGRKADITIEDVSVSRQHAKVTLDGAQVFIEDLGSTNGTKVNDEAVGAGVRTELSNKDVVTLGGEAKLTLSLPGEVNKTLAAVSGKTSAIASAPTVHTAKAWLVFEEEEMALELGTHTFGRRDSNDLVLSNAYVSGSHGQIEVTETAVLLTDLGSTNGTFVNSAKLTPNQSAQIHAGDEIKLGSTEIEIKFRD